MCTLIYSKKNMTVNDEPAVRIKAVLIKKLAKATLFDCEGDKIWVPNTVHVYEESIGTLLVQEWFYNKKVEEGIL